MKKFADIVKRKGKEANLPKAIDMINKAGILGIGDERDQDKSCTGSIGEDRLRRNIQPDIMFLAIPCPTDCDECVITEFGSVSCTVPATGKFIQDGMVVSACPTTGYLVKGTTCISCSNEVNGQGCTTCEEQTVNTETTLACTACDTSLGFTLSNITSGTTTVATCTPAKDCLISEYYNGTDCTSCLANCDLCDGSVCSSCSNGFAMVINADGTRECVDVNGGCPAGHFVNPQFICTPCDASCSSCVGSRPDQCITCADSTQVLQPIQMLKVEKLNMKNEFDFKSEKSDIVLEYENPTDVPKHGTCAADCNIEGFALWKNNTVCTMCGSLGCTECDSTGVCTKCDKKQRLSLIADPADSTKKICEPCELLNSGCRLCEETNSKSCLACKSPKFSLLEDSTGLKTCVRRCPSGMFSEPQVLAATLAPTTMKDLNYNKCSPCLTGCTECKGKGDFCLLCSDAGMFAQPDGTCAATCPAGTFTGDGRCQKCDTNTETCEINSVSGEYKALTCATGFFIDISETKCVQQSQCGKGYFGQVSTGKCTACDATVCSECKDSANFCLKCKDVTKFVSSDGTCKANPADVTCATSQFKNSAGLCLECDKKCDSATGCVGAGDSKCLKCASTMNVLGSVTPVDGTSPTIYKCGPSCPALSEVTVVGGQNICNTCYKDTTKPVFDLSTQTCIAEASGCPATTVLTTLDKITKEDNAQALSFSGTAADVKVCVK